jgi:hypothetical protein
VPAKAGTALEAATPQYTAKRFVVRTLSFVARVKTGASREKVAVCEIFYWRDVTACFTMTYSVKDFDVFAIFFER